MQAFLLSVLYLVSNAFYSKKHNIHMINTLLSTYGSKSGVSSQVSLINGNLYPKKPTSIDNFFSLIRKSDVEEINKGFSFYCSRQKGWEEIKKEAFLKKRSMDDFMRPFLKFREISNIYVIYFASTRFLKISYAKSYNEFNNSIFAKNICKIAKEQNYETFKTFELLLNAEVNKKYKKPNNFFTNIFVNKTKEFCFGVKMGRISKRHRTNIKFKVCSKGNHAKFSEIHQILEVYSVNRSKQQSKKENLIYFQNSQTEILRLYNEIFQNLFGNTPFFEFGMALHSYSFLENEANDNNIQKNCQIRTKKGNNFYCLFQKIHPLNYLLNFILNSEKIHAFNKFAVIKNLKTIFIKVFSNSLNYTQKDPEMDVYFLKDLILANVRKIRKSNKNDYYLYEGLIKINKIINGNNFTDVEEFFKNSYENKELMKNVFNSLYFDEGNYFSVFQFKNRKFLSKQDAEFYFMMNFAMGLEKSLDFFIKFRNVSEKNQKKYYLFETLTNLANFLTVAEKILSSDYFDLCQYSTAVKLSDFYKNNNISISENFWETMDFLESLKKTTVNIQKNYHDKNREILKILDLFREFCENKIPNQKKKGEAECLFEIYKDFTDFVKDTYKLLFV